MCSARASVAARGHVVCMRVHCVRTALTGLHKHIHTRIGMAMCICMCLPVCTQTQAIFKTEDMKGSLREVALEVASEAIVRGGWDNEVPPHAHACASHVHSTHTRAHSPRR